VKGRHLSVNHLGMQSHETRDLFRGSGPVFGRKGVEGQLSQTDITRHLDDPAHGLSARPVTGENRQMAPLGPATIAIHDDGHVERHDANAFPVDPDIAGPSTIAAEEGM
jgi:hypothetical protein